MKRWVTLIVWTLPALAQNVASNNPPMRGVHLTRDEAEAQAKAGGRNSSPNLIYHGGPILKTTSAGAIFWGPSWADSNFAGDKISGIDTWYQGVDRSAYAQTSDEYADSSGQQITAGISYLGHAIDTSPAANGQFTSPILNEACKILASGALPVVSNGFYAVYVDVPRGHARFCAYHSAGSCNLNGSAVPIEFGFFFHLDGDPGCDPQDTSGLHSQGLAALANVSGHELSETRSDPNLNAWYDSSGNENADKCAWSFSGALVKFSNNTYWKIQGNWSNLAFDGGFGYPNLSGQSGCLDGSKNFSPVAK